MRFCLILAVGLFSGRFTSTEVENSGMGTRTTYLGFIPVQKKSFIRPQPHQPQAQLEAELLEMAAGK